MMDLLKVKKNNDEFIYEYLDLFTKEKIILESTIFLKNNLKKLDFFMLFFFNRKQYQKIIKDLNKIKKDLLKINKIIENIKNENINWDIYHEINNFYKTKLTQKYNRGLFFYSFLLSYAAKNNIELSLYDLKKYQEKIDLFLEQERLKDEVDNKKKHLIECKLNSNIIEFFLGFHVEYSIFEKILSTNEFNYFKNGDLNKKCKILESILMLNDSIIKKQYKILAKRFHPDKKGNVKVMQRINELYSKITST